MAAGGGGGGEAGGSWAGAVNESEVAGGKAIENVHIGYGNQQSVIGNARPEVMLARRLGVGRTRKEEEEEGEE
eukprot:CAMPEP_0170184358 /NCGR_PEP_ID=MMETSP0040_2-20121228/33449_1 /TAXON_ID=641309 /ORGANISM="Lotharella oceanica, Strain CCMP622" /LENGTH=72 /DNA_ID=CAMNT_0010430409 /DNA_START=392 /DNA_END=610 /DNA_ORIENTATION=+